MAEILKKRFHRPLVIAHRGLSWTHPENTLASFEAAIASGADMVELDFHSTGDRQLVCVHDSVLNRYMPPGEPSTLLDRPIHSLTLAEVQSLDAGRWKHERFAGSVFPRLEDVLARFLSMPDAPILLIEQKTGSAPQLLELLQQHDAIERVIVQSFNWDFLQEFRALAPSAAIGALGEELLAPGHLERVRELRASAIHWHANRLAQADVERCHAAGLLVWAFTVNSEMAWRGAAQMHIDGITTDRCDIAAQVLSSAMR